MNQTQQYYDDGARYEGIYCNKTPDYFLVKIKIKELIF
jgi:hypothetical protein